MSEAERPLAVSCELFSLRGDLRSLGWHIYTIKQAFTLKTIVSIQYIIEVMCEASREIHIEGAVSSAIKRTPCIYGTDEVIQTAVNPANFKT
jgi:hypothetical protein